MANCPRCGLPIKRVRIGIHEVDLNYQPDPENGNVLSLAQSGNFLQGNDLFSARRNPAVSAFLYLRHGVSCREFWKGRRNE